MHAKQRQQTKEKIIIQKKKQKSFIKCLTIQYWTIPDDINLEHSKHENSAKTDLKNFDISN